MKGMDTLRKVDKMNGISLNSFYGNKGIFANAIFNKNMSRIYGVGVKVQEKDIVNKSKNIQKSADNDTYEHNSMLIETQRRNTKRERPKDWVSYGYYGYDGMNFMGLEDGVSNGFQLSDEAKDFLDELKEEYKNVDFRIAGLSQNTEEARSEKLLNGNKEYSILIDARSFEIDATGEYSEYTRKHWKYVLDNLFGREGKMERELDYDTNFDTVAAWNEEHSKAEILQRGEQVVAKNQNEAKGLYFQIDKIGEKDYVVSLLKDTINEEDDKKALGELQQERMEQKREEVHKQGEADESGEVALIV